ncbi:four-carbon acid sugar kinase family protein [Pollutimonas thiosulfatoxidans]|uniref:Four-carbon acid sugar kinase family protein n=1 Tax=Pollutimonas thiosulfatoxidans TaxID=2028345 RepID=A0A410GEI2_9BURK|nr:four-carbon acid sugar kinase family protein [Pollutimonas thiosulfatoxidans]QAA94679.1 hypothetical protein CKA81_13140 [Pollutimonas thiosulfatoxidans]
MLVVVKKETVETSPQLLIVADDLSGAADCANACRQAGLNASVRLDALGPGGATESSVAALSLDADTRAWASDRAAEVHARILQRHLRKGGHLYKKLDSTLRGNIGAELAAAVEVAGMAIVAPAFPTMGRTTVNGHQLLNGVALQHTEVWRHEGLQGTSDLVGIMRAQNLNTLAVGLSDIRGPADLLRSLFIDSARQGRQVLVCDAERDDDLARIAQASWQLPLPCFWAGSAGLVGHLATAISTDPSVASLPVPPVTGRCLVVVGSMSGISAAQVDQLRRKRAMPLISVSADALMGAEADAGWQQARNALAAALSCGDALVVVSSASRADRTAGPAISKALGRLAATQASHIGAVIATGGETARAVLQALGISSLNLAAEVEPGVPISVASGARTLPVITKAGAFGTAMTLVRCYDALRP